MTNIEELFTNQPAIIHGGNCPDGCGGTDTCFNATDHDCPRANIANCPECQQRAATPITPPCNEVVDVDDGLYGEPVASQWCSMTAGHTGDHYEDTTVCADCSAEGDDDHHHACQYFDYGL